MKAIRLVSLTVLVAALYPLSGLSFWRIGPKWAQPDIVMHLQLGSSGSLIDGSNGWNIVAENALALWNPHISGTTFRVVRDSSATIASGNGVNSVIWDADVFGESFGDAIAVALWWARGDVFSEGDVVFNTKYSWNSYRGGLRSASGGGTLFDIRRVALHEFGHVLGLDHPDEHGQSGSAIMNSRTSDTDSLQSDDINGARALYPVIAVNRSPTVTATCTPCSVDTTQSVTLRATGSDPDGDALSYQWTAPLGGFGTATSSTTSWAAPNDPANVSITVTVRDGKGGSASASVTVQVIRPDRLRSGSRLLPGQSIGSTNGRFRLLYQSDGNLVLYDETDRSAPWSTNTGGLSAGQALMQIDGNFVVYDNRQLDRFSTRTVGNPNAYLLVQNDGNVVVYRADGRALWDRLGNVVPARVPRAITAQKVQTRQ